MNLVIFGPPGSSKGTVSSKLVQELGIEHISPGELFRQEVERGSELGKKVKGYMDKGDLVPDSVVNEAVEKKLRDINKQDFILDGYPRTLEQAEFLDKVVKIDATIFLKTHEEIAVRKILGRRICKNCGKGNYNVADIDKTIDGIHYKLPPLSPEEEGKCDHCGAELSRRDDDTEETIKRRFEIYKEREKPLLNFFQDKTEVVEIWADGTPPEVTEKTLEKIRSLS
ncbi:MAG: adenylate kinase family protein [Candidatus Aenigmatarchaeota archaeon]